MKILSREQTTKYLAKAKNSPNNKIRARVVKLQVGQGLHVHNYEYKGKSELISVVHDRTGKTRYKVHKLKKASIIYRIK